MTLNITNFNEDMPPDEAQQCDDWIKRRYNVPGGPYIQALTILQPSRGSPEQNFKHFLTLPVSRFVSKQTRRQLHLLGYNYPDSHPGSTFDARRGKHKPSKKAKP